MKIALQAVVGFFMPHYCLLKPLQEQKIL